MFNLTAVIGDLEVQEMCGRIYCHRSPKYSATDLFCAWFPKTYTAEKTLHILPFISYDSATSLLDFPFFLAGKIIDA